MAKIRPKYPRRGKLSRIWFPVLGLLIISSVAIGVVFYRGKREDWRVERAVDRLAESLAARPDQTAVRGDAKGNAFSSAQAVSPRSSLSISADPLPPVQGNEPNQTMQKPQDGSPAGATDRPPPPPREGGTSPEKAPGTDKLREAPFGGMTLEQISSEFTGIYGKVNPAQWGERLPGITWRLPSSETLSSGNGGPVQSRPAGGGRPVLALTLDACDARKGVGYDSGIITLLREKNIPATIFVTSIWMRNNPDVLRELASDPLFEIAAHGTRHKPCSVNGRSVYGIKGTASFGELVREVEGNVRDISAATGKRPRWFRSGTAYYDDVAVRVIRDLGLGIAGYSIAGDEGASLSAARVAARTLAAGDGDILLYHLNRPWSGTREGLERALPALLEKGFVFVRLSPDSE